MVGNVCANGTELSMYLSEGIFVCMCENSCVGSHDLSCINMLARSVMDSEITPHSNGFGDPPNVARSAIY